MRAATIAAGIQRSMSGHLVDKGHRVAVLTLLAAAVLDAAAVVGIGYVAGPHDVLHALTDVSQWWPLAAVGLLAFSFAGYFVGYRGSYVARDGPRLPHRHMAAVVVASFGGFVAHGGAALDRYALRAGGVDDHDARVRSATLAGLEQGMLAIAGTVAATVVLAEGRVPPTADVTLPWAVLPVPGFLLAFWMADRLRARLRAGRGWREAARVFLESVACIRDFFLRPGEHGATLVGMTAFWVGDALAMWAALAAFGFRMDIAALIVGYATGTIFSRRVAPLGGAGVLVLILPTTIWYSGAPFAAAVCAVAVYRLATFWLPAGPAYAQLPSLQSLERRRHGHA